MITAKLRPNPVLTLTADHLDLLGTGYNAINNGGPNEFSYRTDFVLERGGKRADRVAVAKAERQAAELGVRNVMRQVVYDTQSAFIEVLAAEASLQLAQDNLKSLNGIVDVNAIRVRSGDLAGVELTRSRVAALQYLTAVQQGSLRVSQAKNRLQLLLGRAMLDDGFAVDGVLERRTAVPPLPQLAQGALQARPDLLNLQATQARSQADLRLQIANGKVDYTVGTEYRRQQGIAGTGNSLGFFFSAPLPVFNRNQGEIARAQREIDQAAARIRALQAGVGTELANAYQQYQSSRRQLENIERTMLGQAQEVRRVTEYSYRRGEASLVEFLDAQRAFNDTMESYNQARAEYVRSLYLIEAVTGSPLPAAGNQVAQTNSSAEVNP